MQGNANARKSNQKENTPTKMLLDTPYQPQSKTTARIMITSTIARMSSKIHALLLALFW
jgi:hypothetical protein